MCLFRALYTYWRYVLVVVLECKNTNRIFDTGLPIHLYTSMHVRVYSTCTSSKEDTRIPSLENWDGGLKSLYG